MGGLDGGEIALPLVGDGVAGGIQADGLVVGVNAAGEQLDGLDHMGMAADDDVDAQVAELLGHGLLLGVGGELILLAPVDEHHGRFGTGGLHLSHILLHLCVEFGEMLRMEVVANPCLFDGGVAVEGGPAVLGDIGRPGVAEHADPDAVDLHDGPLCLVGGGVGAQGVQALLPHHLQSPQVAHQTGVVAVVVGGEHHVKARSGGVVDQVVGTVEVGVAAVGEAVVSAAEGRLQIGSGIIHCGGVFRQVLEHGGEVVGAVRLLDSGVVLGVVVKDGLVHQQVAHGAHARGGYDLCRAAGQRFGGGRGKSQAGRFRRRWYRRGLRSRRRRRERKPWSRREEPDRARAWSQQWPQPPGP